MSTINLVNPNGTTGKSNEIFSQIHSAFGAVPNMFKAIGNSTAALESMWTSFAALGKGNLSTALGEQIAVLVANENKCEYCLSAHTVLGKNAGVSEEAMADAQVGKSSDVKTQTALEFAAKIINNRAQVTKDDIDLVKKAGFSESDVAEILAHVALNVFTNYTNVAFEVPVDFPAVALR